MPHWLALRAAACRSDDRRDQHADAGDDQAHDGRKCNHGPDLAVRGQAAERPGVPPRLLEDLVNWLLDLARAEGVIDLAPDPSRPTPHSMFFSKLHWRPLVYSMSPVRTAEPAETAMLRE